MKAVRIEKPEGLEGIDGLVYEDAPDPQPAIGDALVQVRAASFTRPPGHHCPRRPGQAKAPGRRGLPARAST
jgi:hypothetical protein